MCSVIVYTCPLARVCSVIVYTCPLARVCGPACRVAGDQVSFKVSPTPGFRMPLDINTPVIMVAAGTGIAPFKVRVGGAQGGGGGEGGCM